MRMIVLKELAAVAGGGDGCTLVPDAPFGFNFRDACDMHDNNYSSGSPYSRAEADAIFKADMHNICETNYNDSFACNVMAEVYGAGVSIFGGSFYQGGGSSGNAGGRSSDFDQVMNELY
ncbi:phospholipase A2 [Janthinobacterium sp. J1-1]|uniref:phospholipase A2 n=1 Tax=unclassified Janthinobacterium TaxID=2610881 RepID=UPI002810B92B|nr:phospholipase A2 [Janthinobacterium sp. J1-1]